MLAKQILFKSLVASMAVMTLACSDNSGNNTPEPEGEASYILGLGVTSNGATTNYAVKANDLMTGSISPLGNGLTLIGYRDYSQGKNTVFAVGGLGEANVNGINQNAAGELTLSGSATFDRPADDIQQADDNQMLALELPAKANGNQARFYFVNIDSKAIAKNFSVPLTALVRGGDQPVYTGMAISGSKLFVSHMHWDAGYNTNFVDSNYVAVYSYPEIKFEKLITDPRTGPSGAFGTKNGLLKTENGDIYAMSSSNISNGFSQAKKPGGFLKIKNGESTFDQSYFFNTDNLGGKISHVKYIGNGLAFAAISTIQTQTATDRWGDKKLKLAIIDLVNQKITDVKLEGGTAADLIHDGNGARSFSVLVENGKVYHTLTIGTKTNIYQIDVASATAKKGAEVTSTFVGGIFKVVQ